MVFSLYKYNMINFNKYILNSLNEDKQDIIDDNGMIYPNVSKQKFTNWLKNNLSKIKLEKDKNTGNEALKYNNKVFLSSQKVDYSILSIYNDLKSNKNIEKDENGTIRPIEKSRFELLGKTIGYRSSLAIMKCGDDFKKAVNDVIDDESIRDLENIFEYFSLAGAIKTIYNKKDNSILSHLSNIDTRDKAIEIIRNNFGEEYNKNVSIYKNAFDEGLKAIRTEMAKPNFEWKDPATGLPPQGIKGNVTKFLSKQVAKIGALGESLYNKIPKQHTLENDIARLLCYGVQAMMKGVSVIADLLRSLYDTSQMRKIWSKKKLNDIESEIDNFLKEYNEWKKKEIKKESLENILHNRFLLEEIQEKTDILKKFDDLMYNHVIPYYCYKISNIVYSFENKDELFILKYNEGKWSTNNTLNGKLTIIEDNCKLILNYFNVIKNKLKPVLDDFKAENAQNAFRNWTNFTYDYTIPNEFENFLKQIKIEDLNKFLKVYNEKVIVSKETFKKYDDFIKYVNVAYDLISECKDIVPLNNKELEVDIKELKTNIKGIIIPEVKEDIEDLVPSEFIAEIESDVEKLNNIFNKTDIFISENFEETYDKMQSELEELEGEIKNICSEFEELQEEYNNGKKLINKFKDDLIPQLWYVNNFIEATKAKIKTISRNKEEGYIISTKDVEKFESFSQNLLLQLLEETDIEKVKRDNHLEAYVKSLYNKMKELIYSKNIIEPYIKWKNGVNTLYNKLKNKIDNSYTDPVQQISAICLYIKNKQNS